MADENKRKVEEINQRRKASFDWLATAYYPEFTKVYQAAKCRTDPFMVRDDKGQMVEDKSRTNVAMPDIAVMYRRNAARMTAQPPKLRYKVPGDDESRLIGEKLTARAYFEYDRSGEAEVHQDHVGQEELFGFSVTKIFEDKVEVTRPRRYDREKLTDRKQYLELSGASPEEIDAQLTEKGTQFSPDEIASMIAEDGPEFKANETLVKYEGPRLTVPFIGDFFFEPGMRKLNDCSWMGDQYLETDVWLEDGVKSGRFDEKAAQELLDDGQSKGWFRDKEDNDLRSMLRDAAKITDPQNSSHQASKLVPGKRFLITEQHEFSDGVWKVYWVGNDKVLLNPQGFEYPWDFGGRSAYTGFAGMPDVMNVIGDSTPRLARYLHQLLGASSGQIIDIINNVLRPLYFAQKGSDIPEAVQRSLMKIVYLNDVADMPRLEQQAQVPQSAWETLGLIRSMLYMLEPNMAGVEAGSAANPLSGKTATTSVLASRSNDMLTQAKLDRLDLYHKEVGEKKLAIWQQRGTAESLRVPNEPRFVKSQALVTKYGKSAWIDIDPIEIQDDIGCEPEAMSYLAVDDEFRRMNIQQLWDRAATRPDVFDIREIARIYVNTIPGVDASKVILPPPKEQPKPEPKVTLAISAKYPELPPSTKQLLVTQLTGQPDPDIEAEAQLESVIKMRDAAVAADELESPAQSEMPLQQEQPVRRTMADQM